MHRLVIVIIIIIFVFVAKNKAHTQEVRFEVPMIEFTINKGFDHAHCFMYNQAPHLFCFDSQTGKAGVWNMQNDSKPLLNSSIGKGWNHIIHINNGNASRYLLIDSFHAKIRFLNDILEVGNCNTSNRKDIGLSERWDFTSSIASAEALLLFRYSKSDGKVLINSINLSTNSIGSSTLRSSIEAGWNTIDFAQQGNNLFILKHSIERKIVTLTKTLLPENSFSGESALKAISKRGKTLHEETEPFTNALLFKHEQVIYIFLHNSSSGKTKLIAFDKGLDVPKIAYNEKWSTGWTTFSTISIMGKPHLFHNKESVGLSRISRISIN